MFYAKKCQVFGRFPIEDVGFGGTLISYHTWTQATHTEADKEIDRQSDIQKDKHWQHHYKLTVAIRITLLKWINQVSKIYLTQKVCNTSFSKNYSISEVPYLHVIFNKTKRLKRQPHKMVKHTQTIRQLLQKNCFEHFVRLLGRVNGLMPI